MILALLERRSVRRAFGEDDHDEDGDDEDSGDNDYDELFCLSYFLISCVDINECFELEEPCKEGQV